SATSSALVTPKILTAEELQQRQERRQELKKKIQAEREKKRREKSQRKERLQQEIKRLLGTKTIAGGVVAASDGSGAGVASSGAGGDLIGAGAAGGGGVGGSGAGGSASSDEEFETIKQADLIASLARSYEKSILKTAKPNAGGGSSTAKKSVLFADGVAPGDESSSSGDETKERSPNKLSAAKQRKKMRRQRTLKLTGKKRLIDKLKQPELDEEAEEIDPELESLPPP
ncbi:AGAP011241-PA, partial [Anopheles gambiae str. PEST]